MHAGWKRCNHCCTVQQAAEQNKAPAVTLVHQVLWVGQILFKDDTCFCRDGDGCRLRAAADPGTHGSWWRRSSSLGFRLGRLRLHWLGCCWLWPVNRLLRLRPRQASKALDTPRISRITRRFSSACKTSILSHVNEPLDGTQEMWQSIHNRWVQYQDRPCKLNASTSPVVSHVHFDQDKFLSFCVRDHQCYTSRYLAQL